jgi:hypothetical protein
MISLKQIWESSDREIDTLLSIYFTKCQNINDRKIFLAKLYANEGWIPEEEIKLLSLPNFKKLSAEMPIEDVKIRLSIDTQISDVFDELHLSSLTTSFLEPGKPELVATLNVGFTGDFEEDSDGYEAFHEDPIHFIELQIKEFLDKNSKLTNISLLVCSTRNTYDLLDTVKMDVEAMRIKSKGFLNRYDVVAILTEPCPLVENHEDYYQNLNLYKMIISLYISDLVVVKSCDVMDITYFISNLYCHIIHGVASLESLEWYLYTDPVTLEEKYMVIGRLNLDS